jgi:hypothetical protein
MRSAWVERAWLECEGEGEGDWRRRRQRRRRQPGGTGVRQSNQTDACGGSSEWW